MADAVLVERVRDLEAEVETYKAKARSEQCLLGSGLRCGRRASCDRRRVARERYTAVHAAVHAVARVGADARLSC